MNSTPQVATQEISDTDLDNVSGGLLLNTVDSPVPVPAPVSDVVGTVEGLVP